MRSGEILCPASTFQGNCFHRDILFYFEVASYLVIQMASSLSTGLISCINHKLNWLHVSFSTSFDYYNLWKKLLIWRPKVFQLTAEVCQNAGSYNLSFSKLQNLSDLEEVCRSALKDARHCQLSLKCRLSSIMRNLSQSCFHLISSAQTWHKMPINALFVVQISKTSHALLKLNPKE